MVGLGNFRFLILDLRLAVENQKCSREVSMAANEVNSEKQYDMLLKGGHVIDPANDIDEKMDVGIKEKKIAKVIDVLCMGCGACAAACPSGASEQNNFKDDQIYSMVSATMKEE